MHYDVTFQLYMERLEREARQAEHLRQLRLQRGPRPSLRSRISFSLPKRNRRPRLVPRAVR